MSSQLIVLSITGGLLVIGIILYYSSLVEKRSRAEEAWLQAHLYFERRHDLIGALVKELEGRQWHDLDTLELATKACNQAIHAQTRSREEAASSEAFLSFALAKLLHRCSENPELRSDRQIRGIRAALDKVEDQIAFARMNYNDAAAVLNTALTRFPGRLFGSTLGVDRQPYCSLPKARVQVISTE